MLIDLHFLRSALAGLAAGAYMENGEPVVLLGDSGTGKTHLLIGLGLAACKQGRRVRYVTTAALVNELAQAADQRALSRVVSRYGRLDLLLLGELGYVQIDQRGAELLFQIITEREEKAAVAIGTNLPFSEWGTVFPGYRGAVPAPTLLPRHPPSDNTDDLNRSFCPDWRQGFAGLPSRIYVFERYETERMR